MLNTVRIGFYWCSQRFLRSYYLKEDLNIDEILMNSVREKTSASNEPICKEEKAEFLIALIAISFFPPCLGFGFRTPDCLWSNFIKNHFFRKKRLCWLKKWNSKKSWKTNTRFGFSTPDYLWSNFIWSQPLSFYRFIPYSILIGLSWQTLTLFNHRI
jgi:hypothetical protein